MPNNLTTLSDIANKIEKLDSFRELSKHIFYKDNGDGTVSIHRNHAYGKQPDADPDAKYVSAHDLIYGVKTDG